MQSDSVLILGGSSLIAQDLIKKLKENSFQVDFTYNRNKYRTGIQLNINEDQSREEFMKIIGKKQYKIIINFIGKLSKHSNREESDILLDIMQTNFTSVILLTEKLIKNNLLKNGKIIFLSSISGVDGSYDANYAAAKAALNLYVKSRVKSLDSSVASLVAICPTLIQDSSMYKSMSQVEWTKHKNRKASGELLKFDDLNLKIIEIINSDQESINGKIILI